MIIVASRSRNDTERETKRQVEESSTRKQRERCVENECFNKGQVELIDKKLS